MTPALLAAVDLRGHVVTGDAQFCQRTLSEQVVAQGGAYFWEVKENQPSLLESITTLFAVPPAGERFAGSRRSGQRGDRAERRLLKRSAALADYLDWPHHGQVCTVQRRVIRKGKTTVERHYAITSLSTTAANATRLQALWRGHWSIENRLHWVRDVTFGEDASQVRTGSAPQVMAALRNTAIGLLHLDHCTNIAAALRRHSVHPGEALALLGLT